MPGPTKRSRNDATTHDDTDTDTDTEDQHDAPPTPAPSSSRACFNHRRAPTATPMTPTRPILTRSATTQVATPTHLTRSTSLFAPPRLGLSTGRGGTLFRTQSTSSIPSPVHMKTAVFTGGSGAAGKGEGPSFDLRGAKKLGNGKENIPPVKDEDMSSEGSRKRLRVGRARSGSVASMRSEGGHRASVGPSSSSCISRRCSRLPSPSPSPSFATTRSFDSITSANPLDLIDDENMDVDKTPTKPRPATRRACTLPTPPPSSPLRDPELDVAAKRVQLIRMKSDVSSVASEDITREKTNPYKQLKAFLRLSAGTKSTVDQTIVGREQEKATLRAYLRGKAEKDVGMYICGPPGTGKTALVTAFGRELAAEGWQVVELGCMGLKIGDIWRRLGEAFGCGKSEGEVLAFVGRSDKRTFIILDEIDSLLPPSPCLPPPATSHLLTKLFSLPLSSDAKLIAISNTLDLTFRARLVLPDGVQPDVIAFKAYAGADMTNIVNARMSTSLSGLVDNETVKVDAKAVELLTKKVEAQNGDLRMCLGVLASAISLAETEWAKKTMITEAAVPLIKVSLPHTIKAFNSHTQQLRAAAGSATASTSSTGKKVRSVPLQGKMVLISILVFLSRTRAGLLGCPNGTPTKSTGSDILTTSSLYATYTHILSHNTSPIPAASESDYRDLLSNLEVLGLISLASTSGSSVMSRSLSGSSGRAKTQSGGAKLDLSVREDEVRDGLGLDRNQKGLAEEEVAKIWEREEAKVQRVREKAAAKNTDNLVETFR